MLGRSYDDWRTTEPEDVGGATQHPSDVRFRQVWRGVKTLSPQFIESFLAYYDCFGAYRELVAECRAELAAGR